MANVDPLGHGAPNTARVLCRFKGDDPRAVLRMIKKAQGQVHLREAPDPGTPVVQDTQLSGQPLNAPAAKKKMVTYVTANHVGIKMDRNERKRGLNPKGCLHQPQTATAIGGKKAYGYG